MQIAIIGTGYVGLTSGACFAENGNHVVCVDIDDSKILKLRDGHVPIYEPGLKELIEKNQSKGRIDFTTDLARAIDRSDIIFIAVGTPSLLDGEVDLTYVRSVAEEIGKNLYDYKIIVVKSTVPVGTSDLVKTIIKKNLPNQIEFDVASVPEFLREGSAINDIFNPERIIIGIESERSRELLAELHRPLNAPVHVMDIRSAELTKYAANAFLAMKISFINQIANICDKLNADVEQVAKGIGADSRIGHKYLNAGIGYGGSCFPKDTRGLLNIADYVGQDLALVKEVIRINERQYQVLLDKLKEAMPYWKYKTIAIMGLAFKPNTDDMRDAPSISVIRDLKRIEPTLTIRAYDPIAKENAQQVIQEDIQFCSSIEETVINSDACLIVTEWQEIIEFGLDKYKQLLKDPIIVDGRNCFSPEQAAKIGIKYYSIGRQTVDIQMEVTS